MQAVLIRGACKSYGKKVELNNVLNNLNMNVERGSIYALMGSSGCGKSTLLSCIVGSLKLNEGSVEVLGSFGSEIPMKKIGFMPQEYALVNEFTVQDVTFFFGRLYGMCDKKIKERFKVLSTLLELPVKSKLIGDCSGGQKRRISFAVSMLHEPELLILDEPTVGLDSLLREKIWNYLLEQTIQSQVTVIITTHYIHEASKANRVGLMRNGLLIAEETPENLLNQLEVDSLQDAFIKLSLKQNSTDYSNIFKIDSIENSCYKSNDIEPKASSTTILKRLTALMFKNTLQTYRFSNFFGILCNLTLPLACFLIYHYSIGCDPIGLKIGIVNDEINYNDCFNKSLITTIVVENKSCEFNKISCRFINQFNDSIAEKVFYRNYEEALYDAVKGRMMGVIYFASNFTESFSQRTSMKSKILNESYENSDIQIYLDQSDLQLSMFLKSKIFETYKEFSEKLFSDCGLPKKLGNVPVAFQQPIYGHNNEMIQVSTEPAYLLTLMFLLAAMASSIGILVDRTAGIWNRSLVVGASVGELIVSHMLTQTLMNTSQLIIVIIFRSWISDSSNQYNALAFLIILLTQFSGMVYGFTISVITDSFKMANYTMIGLAFPSIFLSGFLWPTQGLPKFLQFVSKALHFNLPAIALINVVYKGHKIIDTTVLEGFGISFLWILMTILVSFIILKHKKFSHVS